MQLQPVILSGGSGTRLWPLSREKHPKQLLALTSDDTMLQATALRLNDFQGEVTVSSRQIVVCNEEYRFITAEQLRIAGFTDNSLLLEPAGRNTAPALTLAALNAMQQGDAILLVMPADHVIADVPAFHRAINQGLAQARDGAMVTFGIVPTHAETGYGYIRVATTGAATEISELQAFVEKPDLVTAQSYLAAGNYYWNSGIFMMRASTWLKAIQQFQPLMYQQCQAAMASAKVDSDFIRVNAEAFLACPSDSIDYAVMEKISGQAESEIPAFVVPLDAGWSDVGAWDAVWQVSEKDARGNVQQGDTLLEDCENCLVLAESRLVSCLGLQDAIVVETPDAILVTTKQHTQDIKKIVSQLKQENYPQTSNHRKVYRPWGHYDSVDSGAHFQVKRIVVKPGARLSMQMHHHRAEHWVVVSGTAVVTRGDEVMTLVANQSTYIPLGVKHRLENPGTVDLELIEVQSGTYLGEDDIVRFDDIYGRTDAPVK